MNLIRRRIMKFDYKDWPIEPEIETGNDGYIYGNLVDWDRFRRENEEGLISYFNIEMPWNKELTIDEYEDFISQDIFQEIESLQGYLDEIVLIEVREKNEQLVSEINEDDLSDFLESEIPWGQKITINEYEDLISNDSFLKNGSYQEFLEKILSIKIVDRKESVANDLISEIFEHYEVPDGIEYEHDATFQEEFRHWKSDEWDAISYKIYPIELEKYEYQLGSLIGKIKTSEDPVIQKALILYSLIITESMFKSVIVEKIPEEREISSIGKKMLNNEYNKILRGSIEGKKQLFKDLYDKTAPSQAWINLRNSLAHDIESSSIQNGVIEYLNLRRGETEEYILSNLETELYRFSSEIKDIIDEASAREREQYYY